MVSYFLRATIIVSDLEKSLAFYRDIIGLKVQSERVLSERGERIGVPGAVRRLIILDGEGSENCTVGLLSFLEPKIKPREQVQKFVSNVDVAMVFNTNEIEEIYQRMKKAGTKILEPPTETEIIGRGKTLVFACLDPDGVYVEFLQS